MVSVPATRSACPGLESRPGAGLRGGRSLCEYGSSIINSFRATESMGNDITNAWPAVSILVIIIYYISRIYMFKK